jgi:Arc/MetJ family transcription regulator
MILEASMRTTLAIKEEILEEVKSLSGAKTKKEAVEKALEEYIKRRKSKKLIGLEGKIKLSFGLEKFLERRKKDVPYR